MQANTYYTDEYGRKVRVIVAETRLDCEHLLGQFMSEENYDTLIEEDCDVYGPVDCSIDVQAGCDRDCNSCDKQRDERRIIAVFRKNFFSKELQDQAYASLREAATVSENRGFAGGPMDYNKPLGARQRVHPWQIETVELLMGTKELFVSIEEAIADIKDRGERGLLNTRAATTIWREKDAGVGFNFDVWLEEVLKLPRDEQRERAKIARTWIGDTTYANRVRSGVAGWYDRYPRFPYLRPTAYTRNNPEKFQGSYPFLQHLSDAFSKLLPKRYAAQKKAADRLDPGYLVPGTVFTTLTVNSNFRTGAHRDAGDLVEGFSNLLVLSNNSNYSGGYLVCPEFRVAFNVRPGDLLLIANHDAIHGNTELKLHDEEAERVSLVCYFREGMLAGGEKEYEEMRFDFIESRRTNKDHPLQRHEWNGVSPNCLSDHEDPKQDWSAAQEWYDYLKSKGSKGEKYLQKYHPWLKEYFERSGVDAFFS